MFHSANRGPAGNRTWFQDSAVDRLIELSQSTVDERERYRLYRLANDRIVHIAPWVFMWHRSDYYAVQPWVQDSASTPSTPSTRGWTFP